MDSSNLLAVIDADGDFAGSPYIHFSTKGNLLAISADDNQIKILANNRGRQLLQESAFAFGDSSCGSLRESFRKATFCGGKAPFPCQGVLRGNGAAEEISEAIWNSKPKGTEEAPTNMDMPKISKIVEMARVDNSWRDVEVERLAFNHYACFSIAYTTTADTAGVTQSSKGIILSTFYKKNLSARKCVLEELKAVIEANPLLRGRMRFP
ncbi:hypothetical protein OROGR_013382 [Orobanche gracilis]